MRIFTEENEAIIDFADRQLQAYKAIILSAFKLPHLASIIFFLSIHQPHSYSLQCAKVDFSFFFRYFSLIILRGRLRWLTVSFVRLISVTASYHVVPYQVAVKIDDLQHVIGQAIIFLLCGYYYLRQ